MADDKNPKEEYVHPLVGLPHDHVDDNDERIVYEYDEDHNFIGWHKEVTE
jgi:hypothetical protein